MKIKDLPRLDRPVEKLIRYGPEKLSEKELLAILIGSGSKELNALSVAQRLLSKFSDINISEVSYHDLYQSVPNLGAIKSCRIIASFELAKRIILNKKIRLIISPKDVFERLEDIRSSRKEYFVVFCLDSRHQEIKKEIISVGTVDANLIHPREVFEPAIRYLSSQIILAHNHPSGVSDPSSADISITEKLKEVGKMLGILVIDHIIVCKDKYYSFKEHKILN